MLAWDVWNEPDKVNRLAYFSHEPANKVDLVLPLLRGAFVWAREANPSQPLTSGVWQGDWSATEKLSLTEKIQLDFSDVISFHNYDAPAMFGKRVDWLTRYGRPVLSTEYMARGSASTFEGTLPIAKHRKVASYNWGFVVGKTRTNLPWDSWTKPYLDREPDPWFHEIFHPDGTPYRPAEIELIRALTGKGQTKATARAL